MHVDPLMAQQLQTRSPMLPAAPILPEHGSGANHQWMQQHADLPWLRRGTALPLTLLAQRARATTADAGPVHHAQAPISFPAPSVGYKGLASRTAQRAIRLKDKVLTREAALFPEQAHRGFPIPLNRSLCGGLLVRRRESRSKLCCAHLSWLKDMTQLQTVVPEPLRDDLPCLLTVCRMADPAVGVLFLVFISQRIDPPHRDADTAPPHHWR